MTEDQKRAAAELNEALELVNNIQTRLDTIDDDKGEYKCAFILARLQAKEALARYLACRIVNTPAV